MKKYFTKIIAVSLLLAVVPLTSGFCFQGMFSSTLQVNEVKAAQLDVNTAVSNEDVCGDKQATDLVNQETPKTNNHHSLMPCCVDGTHAGIASISQAIEQVKIIPLAVIPINHEQSRVVAKLVNYHTPIISPPELISVRTTILRL